MVYLFHGDLGHLVKVSSSNFCPVNYHEMWNHSNFFQFLHLDTHFYRFMVHITRTYSTDHMTPQYKSHKPKVQITWPYNTDHMTHLTLQTLVIHVRKIVLIKRKLQVHIINYNSVYKLTSSCPPNTSSTILVTSWDSGTSGCLSWYCLQTYKEGG